MALTVVSGAPPPPPPRSRLDEDASRFFDYAMIHRDGFTRPEVEDEFNWNQSYFHTVERRLREILGSESENVVCNPDPDNPKGPWIYWLTDDPELTVIWYANRLDDAETRLATMCNVAQSAMHRYDARTKLGKKARVLYTHSHRALEDLTELNDAV